MSERSLPLHTHIAIALFGWQWRDEWQAWCPPGWPPISVINPPYLDKLHALERHGGQPYGSSGAIVDPGPPVTPSYPYQPDALQSLWQLLHVPAGRHGARIVALALPADS